jgi:hypothetical protein
MARERVSPGRIADREYMFPPEERQVICNIFWETLVETAPEVIEHLKDIYLQHELAIRSAVDPGEEHKENLRRLGELPALEQALGAWGLEHHLALNRGPLAYWVVGTLYWWCQKTPEGERPSHSSPGEALLTRALITVHGTLAIPIPPFDLRHEIRSAVKSRFLVMAEQAIEEFLDRQAQVMTTQLGAEPTPLWPRIRQHMSWFIRYQVLREPIDDIAGQPWLPDEARDDESREVATIREGVTKAAEALEQPRLPNKRGRRPKTARE